MERRWWKRLGIMSSGTDGGTISRTTALWREGGGSILGIMSSGTDGGTFSGTTASLREGGGNILELCHWGLVVDPFQELPTLEQIRQQKAFRRGP